MRRGRKLCDRRLADKARLLAAGAALAVVGSGAAIGPADPCREIRVSGLPVRISCPRVARLTHALADTIARSVGRSLPIVSASAGFAYRYDPDSDTFARVTAIPGQLYLETPTPVGRGRWNASVSYQHVAFDSLDGKPLDDLRDTHPPLRVRVESSVDVFTMPVAVTAFAIDTQSHQVTASVTYGVTTDLDLNVTVPVVSATTETRFRFRLGGRGGIANCGALSVRPCPQGTRETQVGVGDVFLRGKYRVLDRAGAEAAVGLVVRLPTGDPDAPSGLGVAQVGPMLYAAGPSWRVLGSALTVRPSLNAGFAFDADDTDRSEGRWGIGADFGILGRATLGAAVLGRHAFARAGPPDLFDMPRCGALAGFSCAPGPAAPLFGLENTRPDFFDAAVGLRVNLWREVLVAFASVLMPLNDAGLRADIVPLAGIEAAF